MQTGLYGRPETRTVSCTSLRDYRVPCSFHAMKIGISGGSGFLGHALAERLAHDGHAIVVLTRGAPSAGAAVQKVTWQPDGSAGAWRSEIESAGAVINLAGESI